MDQFKRPRFIVGERINQKKRPQPIRPIKARPPADKFKRKSFKSQSIAPRKRDSIADVQKKLTKQLGVKVRFGDEPVGKIRVVKRDANGRPLRDRAGNIITVEKDFNFGLLSDVFKGSFADNVNRLDEQNNLIRSGAISQQVGVNELATTLAQVLNKIENIDNMSAEQERVLKDVYLSLQIPTNPMAAGLPGITAGRFLKSSVHRNYTDGDKNKLLAFLSNKALSIDGLDLRKPVFGFSGRPIFLNSFDNVFKGSISKPNPVIDLDTNTLYNDINTAGLATGLLRPGDDQKSLEDEAPVFEQPTLSSASQRPPVRGELTALTQAALEQAGVLSSRSRSPTVDLGEDIEELD